MALGSFARDFNVGSRLGAGGLFCYDSFHTLGYFEDGTATIEQLFSSEGQL
jgi:hypothetical protein